MKTKYVLTVFAAGTFALTASAKGGDKYDKHDQTGQTTQQQQMQQPLDQQAQSSQVQSSQVQSAFSSQQQAQAYQAAVNQTLSRVEERVSELKKSAAAEPSSVRDAINTAAKEVKSDTKQVRNMSKKLQGASGNEFLQLHGDIQSKIREMHAKYEHALLQASPQTLAVALLPDTELRARAAELFPAQEGQQPTDYAQLALQKLETYEQINDQLKQQSSALPGDAQSKLNETSASIKDKIADARESARKLQTTSNQDEWIKLHDEVESSFRDVGGELVAAGMFIERQSASAPAGMGNGGIESKDKQDKVYESKDKDRPVFDEPAPMPAD